MGRRDVFDLVLLGAIWGASFLFTRIAVPAFGPVALIAVRVGIAAIFLLILLALQGKLTLLQRNVWAIALLGAINTAIPFTLFAYATISINAGFASVLNGTVPLFSAAIALWWKVERLPPLRMLGLLVGFLGVIILVFPKLAVSGEIWAISAGLAAANLYGFAAHYSRMRFTGEDPLAVSTGCLCAASLMLLPVAAFTWPEGAPGWTAWGCAAALGLLCTATAYLIYFRLLNRIGAMRSVTVTYLIPGFGMLWGSLFLNEPLTWNMLIGCAVILIGTALVVRSNSRTGG